MRDKVCDMSEGNISSLAHFYFVISYFLLLVMSNSGLFVRSHVSCLIYH